MDRRPPNSHRHTVPNTSYSSFPCYQEELKLKTNVRQCGTSDGATDAPDHDNFQLNVSMHDKLKMCFAEMETMKDQFDSRRRRLPTKRRSQKERPPAGENTQAPSSASEQPGISKSVQHPKTSESGKSSHEKWENENKFKAHLIRTCSRDSMEGIEKDKSSEQLSHSPAYEETIVSPTSHLLPESVLLARSSASARRAVSDPMGSWTSLKTEFNNRQTIYGEPSTLAAQSTAPHWSNRLSNLAQAKSADTRRSYDEWLQKLDQVNDISRSTLKRIRHLEGEVNSLKNATDSLSSRQKSSKAFPSKIPVTVGSSPINYTNGLFRNNPLKKYSDKSINTDIDMKSMNDILATWKSKAGPLMTNLVDVPFIDEPGRITHKAHIRRLTTTLGRSVEIQTESEQKSHQEIGISTDDWSMDEVYPRENNLTRSLNIAHLSTAKPEKLPTSQMSILDMPNIETGHFISSLPVDIRTRTNVKTPEPIVEIYSDTDETSSFDDFEKNIYNQISKRALIKSRLAARKNRSYESSMQDEPDPLKLRNSATQTNAEQESAPMEKLSSNDTTPAQGIFASLGKKNLCSTSKIVIERMRMNEKEKSEIVLKTDIDKEGVVHRTTEVKNSKYKPKKGGQSSRKTPMAERTTDPEPKHLRKVNSDMNMRHNQRGPLSRPLSAFDIPNSELAKKKDDHFISDKALSSIDIAAKSPISEGYHSEYLDSSTNRIHTPTEPTTSEYLIEPPRSFRNRDYNDWQEVSKSAMTNKTVNEALDGFKELSNGGLITLTNETVIDNTGKKTNITTKSRTIRKYKPQGKAAPLSASKAKSNLDLSNPIPGSSDNLAYADLCPSQSVSQFNLNQLSGALQPVGMNSYLCKPNNTLIQSNQSLSPSTVQPAMCNFSLVYNFDNNLVFSANFGLAKLPCFETNL